MRLKIIKLFFVFCFVFIFCSCGTAQIPKEISDSTPEDKEYTDTIVIRNQNVNDNRLDTIMVKRILIYNIENKKYDTTSVFLKNTWLDTLEIVNKNTIDVQQKWINYNSVKKIYDTTEGKPFTIVRK
jgi:hypothetical protein